MVSYEAHSIFKYLAIFVVVAVVFGGGAYLLERQRLVNYQKTQSASVATLKSHINSLNSQLASLKSAEKQATAKAATIANNSTLNACKSSDLSASLVNGQGTAGTYYYDLMVKNASNQSCTFSGPVELAALGKNGIIVGSVGTELPPSFKLTAGESIYANVGFPNPNNYPANECSLNVTSLSFYPPGDIGPVDISTAAIKDNQANSYCPGFSMNTFSTQPA